mmetsp:Transcript_18394/g.28691  ORF Transcript_18394/g.28691 Transcript_18394/m.28691 type:complete len:225 (+) Transcript_18394:89-763(+)
MSFFGLGKKGPDLKEQVKAWRLSIKSEMRKLDRQIMTIEREEKKIKTEAKKAAKDNQLGAAQILAKEIVRSRKAKERILCTKANMNSIDMQLGNQMATVRLAGAVEKSTEFMTQMNSLVKIPEIAETMRSMAQEMQKAEIIDEMMQDTFEDLEPENMEEESELEIQKVLEEVTGGQLAEMNTAPTALPTRPAAAEEPAAAEADADDGEVDLSEMQARIAALKAA